MHVRIHSFKAAAVLGLMMGTFLLILSSGCSSSGGQSNPTGPGGSGNPGPNEVWIQNFAFNPESLTVAVGDTVTWTNKDNTTHTVTSGTPGNPDGLFNSGNLAPNAAYSHIFDSAGTYNYYCIPHQTTMQGVVVVQ